MATDDHIAYALEPTQYYEKPKLGLELYEEAFKFCRAQKILDAVRCCRELYQIGLGTGNSYVQGVALHLLASVYFALGNRGNDWERAVEYFEQSARLFHTYCDKDCEHNEGAAWLSLGRLYEKQCETGKCRYEDAIAAYIQARDLFNTKHDTLFPKADDGQRWVELKFRAFLQQPKSSPQSNTEAHPAISGLNFAIKIAQRRGMAQDAPGTSSGEQIILAKIDDWRNMILKEINDCLESQHPGEVRAEIALQSGKLEGFILLTAVGGNALAFSKKNKNLGADVEVFRCDAASIIKQKTLKTLEKSILPALLPAVIVVIDPPVFYVPVQAKVASAPRSQPNEGVKSSFPFLRLLAMWSLIFIVAVFAILALLGIDRILVSNETLFFFGVGFLVVLVPISVPFMVLVIAGQLFYRLLVHYAAIEEMRGRIWIIEDPGWHWLFPFFEQLLAIIPPAPAQFQWTRREVKASNDFSAVLNVTIQYRITEIEQFWRSIGAALRYVHVCEIRRPFSADEIICEVNQHVDKLLTAAINRLASDPVKRNLFNDDAELTRRVLAMLSVEMDSLGLECSQLDIQAYL